MLIKTLFWTKNNISCKLSYSWCEVFVLGCTISSWAYDMPLSHTIIILRWHLWANHIGPFCTGPQDSPRVNIDHFCTEKLSLQKLVTSQNPNIRPQISDRNSRDNSISDKSYGSRKKCWHSQKKHHRCAPAYLGCGLQLDASQNGGVSSKKFARPWCTAYDCNIIILCFLSLIVATFVVII